MSKKSKIKQEESQVEKELDKKEEEEFNEEVRLSEVQRLQLMVSHLEQENVKKEISALHNKTEFLEREKAICKMRINDLKSRVAKGERNHQELIGEIGRKLGVKMKDAVVDMETGLVTF